MTGAERPSGRHAARLSELADYVVPFTIRAVADLGIADLLVDGPLPAAELAARTGTHALTLERALRALACRGIFAETEPSVFGLSPLAEPLREDHPYSLRQAYPLLAPEIKAWAHFDHTLRTGTAAFPVAHGVGFWEYMQDHPDESLRFDTSQEAVTGRELRALVPAYEWASVNTIVDVGGGNGAFLTGLLAALPHARGTVFDQPHVVASAPERIAATGLADRCTVVPGSFFDTVPAGADVYVLKRILYGWSDDLAVDLLRAVRAAMRADSRLLLLEPVVEPGNEFDWGKLYDLLLVTMSGGGARSRPALDVLFGKAGLVIDRVIRTRSLPIVEARPS